MDSRFCLQIIRLDKPYNAEGCIDEPGYSKENCQLECAMEYYKNICNCTIYPGGESGNTGFIVSYLIIKYTQWEIISLFYNGQLKFSLHFRAETFLIGTTR